MIPVLRSHTNRTRWSLGKPFAEVSRMVWATVIFNIFVPTLQVMLLWIECRNTGWTPDRMNVIFGVLLIAAPYILLSLLSLSMQRQRFVSRMAGLAGFLIGVPAVLLLASNTSYLPVMPGGGYENIAPPIVLIGQCIGVLIVTPVLLFLYFTSQQKCNRGKTT